MANFREGEMLEYKSPEMEQMKLVMVKKVISHDGELGGLYKCFAISPGFNLEPDVNDHLEGIYLTRFL